MEWLLNLLPLWFVVLIGAFSVLLAVLFLGLPLAVFCMKPLRRGVDRSNRTPTETS